MCRFCFVHRGLVFLVPNIHFLGRSEVVLLVVEEGRDVVERQGDHGHLLHQFLAHNGLDIFLHNFNPTPALPQGEGVVYRGNLLSLITK